MSLASGTESKLWRNLGRLHLHMYINVYKILGSKLSFFASLIYN